MKLNAVLQENVFYNAAQKLCILVFL